MQTSDQSLNRGRRLGGTVLITLTGLGLLASGAVKFAHVPKVVEQLGGMGFSGERLTLVAVLEVVSAILFLIPMTRAAGLLMVSAFLGGAIATHVQHGEPALQPAVFLGLLWLGVWLRHPVVVWSLLHGRQEHAPVRQQENGLRARGA